MRTPAIVKIQILADQSAGFADAVIGPQIDFLVFDAAPQPFDEDVVAPAPLPSILMAMLFLLSTLVKAVPVNMRPSDFRPHLELRS